MNANVEKSSSSLDPLKWLVVVAIVLGGVAANSYYTDQVPALWRAMAMVAVVLVAGGIAYFTEKGKAFAELIKEARVEVKKVVWPTGAETHQSTLIVLVMVIITALILWGLDSLLAYIVKLLIG